MKVISKNKRNFIKSILTTTTLAASLFTCTSANADPEAMIVDYDGSGVANMTIAAYWWNTMVPIWAPDPLTIAIGRAGLQRLDIDLPVEIKAFDLNKGSTNVKVHHNASGGSIGSIGNGSAAGVVNFIIEDATSYSFTGKESRVNEDYGGTINNDYSGVGSIVLGSAGAGGAELILNAANGSFRIDATVDGDHDDKGKLTINSSGNILGGNIGANHSLHEISVNKNTTMGGANTSINTVKATNTYIADGITLTIDSTDHQISYTGSIDGLGAPNKGSLTFIATPDGMGNTNSVTIHGPVGATRSLSEINVGSARVNFEDTVSATTINTGAGGVSFANNVTGDIKFIYNAAQVLLGANMTLNGNVICNTGNNFSGTVVINGNNVTVAGNLGDLNAALEKIHFAGNYQLNMNKPGDRAIIAGPITTANDGEGTLHAQRNLFLQDQINPDQNKALREILIDDNVTLTAAGSIRGANTLISFDGQDAVLEIGYFSTIEGKIRGVASGNGIVRPIAGMININAEIGGTGNPIYALEVPNGCAATIGNATPNAPGSVVKFDGGVGSSAGDGQGIILGDNSVLTIGTGRVFNFANNAAIDGSADKRGTIKFLDGKSIPSASSVSIGENFKLEKLVIGDDSIANPNPGTEGAPIAFANDLNANILDLHGALGADRSLDTQIYLKMDDHLKVDGIIGNRASNLVVLDALVEPNYTIGTAGNPVNIIFGGNKNAQLTLNNSFNIGSLTGNVADIVLEVNHDGTISGDSQRIHQIAIIGSTLVAEGTSSIAEYVTSDTHSPGILHIKSTNNPNYINSEIGVDALGNYANLSSILLENVQAAFGYEFATTGHIIGADEIKFHAGHRNDQLNLNVDLGGGMIAPPTQLILGNITSANSGYGIVIPNNPVMIGGVGSNIQKISFDYNEGIIYLGKVNTTTVPVPIVFNQPNAKLIVFGGNLTLENNIGIAPGNNRFGSIIGNGLSAANAIAAIKASNEVPLDLANRQPYTGTISIRGVVGTQGAEKLSLVDASPTGKVNFSASGPINIRKVVANELILSGSGNYAVDDISDVEKLTLDLANNSNRLDGSFLGSGGSPISVINLNSGDIATPSGATIYATKFNHNNAILAPDGNLTIKGRYNTNNAKLEMSQGTFAVDGDTVLTGTYNTTIYYQTGPIPKLDFSASSFDVSALTSATLVLDTTHGMPNAGTDVGQIIITDPTARAAFFSKLTLTSTNVLVDLSSDQNTGKITNKITMAPITSSGISDAAKAMALKVLQDNEAAIAALGQAAAAERNNVLEKQAIVSSNQAASVTSMVADNIADRLIAVNPMDNASFAPVSAGNIGGAADSSGSTSQVNATVDSGGAVGTNDTSGSSNAPRAKSNSGDYASTNNGGDSNGNQGSDSDFGNKKSNTSSDEDGTKGDSKIKAASGLEGIAAGDVAEKFGIWANLIGGVAKQGVRKGNPGFKSDIIGGIFGADTMLNESVILGVAVGNALSNIKYKDIKQGDTAKSDSWIIAGYGNYNLRQNCFVRGSLMASINTMSSKESRLKLIATSKYNMQSYAAEATVGRNFKALNNVILTPTFGLRTTYVEKVSYTEKGADALNKHVIQKASTNISLLAGLGVATMHSFNEVAIMPEAHVNLQHGLDMKSPQGSFRLTSGGQTVNFVGTKAAALSTTVGGSLTAYSDNVEYSFGYDMNISDKYLGHQGSIKMKIKF